MNKKFSRRSVLKNLAGSAAFFSTAMALPGVTRASALAKELASSNLKGNINHSVCKWCYPKIALEDLCKAATLMGLASIELLGPEEWPTLRKYGITCATIVPNTIEER